MNPGMPPSSKVAPGLPHKPRLALICDSLEDNFQAALVDAGLAAARAYDVDLLVVPSGKLGDEAGRNFVFELVPKWADGAVVAAHTIGHTATEAAMRHFMDLLAEIPTVTLGEVPGARCCLSIDNERAAYDLTQHLVLQHRYQRFAYLCGPAGNSEAEAREHGFNLALKESGLHLPTEWRVVGDFTAPLSGLPGRSPRLVASLEAAIAAYDRAIELAPTIGSGDRVPAWTAARRCATTSTAASCAWSTSTARRTSRRCGR